VRSCRERDKPYFTSFEMSYRSYVVYFRNRTELADPQALFTFTHPNRGECLKLILLSRTNLILNIWYEFDRNADRQQPLWSSKISYQMRFDASRFRWLFRLLLDEFWTLDVSRCSCAFKKWLIKLIKHLYFMKSWIMVQVKVTSLVLVPTWLLTILLFTYVVFWLI
jgi:hypothetical protein